MKTTFLCLFFSVSVFLFAQERDERVRDLNEVVELMTETSRQSIDWAMDAFRLHDAIEHSKEKILPNFFYCTQTIKSGKGRVSGNEKDTIYPSIHRDAEGFIPSYESLRLPWLRQRKKVMDKMENGDFETIRPALESYLHAMEEVFENFLAIQEYVVKKQYEEDAGFKKAIDLLKKQEKRGNVLYVTMKNLWAEIQNVYVIKYPSVFRNPLLAEAKQEMDVFMKMLDTLEPQVYEGDERMKGYFDEKIRQHTEKALSKRVYYFSATKGYDVSGSGFFLSEKFWLFYGTMDTDIFWFATSKAPTYTFSPKKMHVYNTFVRQYNRVAEKYNRYIELGDAEKYVKKHDCCITINEIDTNQRVMLQRPLLPHRFLYQEQEEEKKEEHSIEVLLQHSAPHHVIYLLDVSQSMVRSGALDNLKKEIASLVQLQRDVDKISIVTFSTEATIVLSFVSCSEKAFILEKITQLQGAGFTNISLGLEVVNQWLMKHQSEVKEKTFLVLISDGNFKVTKKMTDLMHQISVRSISSCFMYLNDLPSEEEQITMKKKYALFQRVIFLGNTDYRKQIVDLIVQ